jgi:cobalt-zinc-cadmium efflux system membrane fusion protein
MFWKLMLAILVIAGLGGAVYLGGVSKAQVKEVLRSLGSDSSSHGGPASREGSAYRYEPPPPWDGLVTVEKNKQVAIGLRMAPVLDQTEPLKLELTGRTAYDDTTLTKIRPRFDTLVVQVHGKLGDAVHKGEPLVDLYSTELAQAKSDFQTKFVQWQHDKKLYDLRENLVKNGAISNQLWVDTQNDEQKSRLDYYLALDKLQVYEVPKEEIDPLVERLKNKAVDTLHFGDVSEKAKMTLRAKGEGIIIEREVVPGNYYDTSNVLMVIAPLDHLWVQVNVYELDQDKVSIGQTMEIRFPYLDQKIQGKVQYVANEVSKETRAVKVRATIPNPGGGLKADMLVKAILDIPPVKGQTVIPRLAMVTINGEGFVFVHKADATSGRQDKFERRKIAVSQENADQVVVASGLNAGEEVVTNGSLILSQMFEDLRTVDTGLPTQ